MKSYEDIIKFFLISRFSKIYLIDIINDKSYEYSFINNTITNTDNTSFTNFISKFKNELNDTDFNNLINNLSIQKLEQELLKGNKKLKTIVNKKIETGEEKKFSEHIYLININNDKIILMLEEETSINTNKNSDVEDKIKTNNMIDSISDALLKIYNVFNTNTETEEVKNIGNYVNTILSNLITTYPEFNKAFNDNAISLSCQSNQSLLIIDDDKITCNILKKIFENEYNIIIVHNGEEAINLLKQNNNKNIFETRDNIVAIFLDLLMPIMDGFAVLDYLNNNNYLNKIPVAIISGDYSKETREKVYNYHIADMLEKPFNIEIIKHRINNLINLYKSSNSLNEMVLNQYTDLRNIIDTIVSAYKYDYKSNITKVNKYSYALGEQILNDYPEYNLTISRIDKISKASTYYDIGYYAIPRVIFTKSSNFTTEEKEMVKNYPLIGAKIVRYSLNNIGDQELINYTNEIVKFYHERYDGKGYPDGLEKENIPISSAIVALAVEYNNLMNSHKNDYKNIVNTIISKSGTKYNPKLIESFKKVIDQFEKISKEV